MLQYSLREGDDIYRLGGDEFVLLLPRSGRREGWWRLAGRWRCWRPTLCCSTTACAPTSGSRPTCPGTPLRA
ncbi:hypothetical protein [Oceanithermus sp.]